MNAPTHRFPEVIQIRAQVNAGSVERLVREAIDAGSGGAVLVSRAVEQMLCENRSWQQLVNYAQTRRVKLIVGGVALP